MTNYIASNQEGYPLDFDAITKGMVISQSDIEQSTGVKLADDPTKYQLKQLWLCGAIERHKTENGDPMIVKSDGDSIRTLTDIEAVPYTHSQVESSLRRVRKNFRRMIAVDDTKLGHDDKRRLEHQTFVTSRMVGAMERAKVKAIADAKRKLLTDTTGENR